MGAMHLFSNLVRWSSHIRTRRAPYLNPIKPSLVTQIGCLTVATDQIMNFGNGQGAWFGECVVEPLGLELDVTRTDRVGVQSDDSLPAWMGELGKEQGPMGFGGIGQLLELLEAVVVVVAKDWVSKCFHCVVTDHDVAADDDANLGVAPFPIQVDQLLAWYTTLCLYMESAHNRELQRPELRAHNVVRVHVPATQALGHGRFQEPVFGYPPREGKFDRLA